MSTKKPIRHREKTRDVPVEWMGFTVTVRYAPMRAKQYPDRYLEEGIRIGGEAVRAGGVLFLGEILTSWRFGDGEWIQVTMDGLRQLPDALLGAILLALKGDVQRYARERQQQGKK